MKIRILALTILSTLSPLSSTALAFDLACVLHRDGRTVGQDRRSYSIGDTAPDGPGTTVLRTRWGTMHPDYNDYSIGLEYTDSGAGRSLKVDVLHNSSSIATSGTVRLSNEDGERIAPYASATFSVAGRAIVVTCRDLEE